MRSILLFLIFILSAASGQVTYVYKKDVDGKESKTTWTLKLKEDILHISGESLTGNILILTTPDRTTKSFSQKSKRGSNEYTIVRDGNYLIATKITGGSKKEEKFKIGNNLWVQEFDFAFKPFIVSNFSDFKFSIINPKQFDLHDMVATKQGLEKLQLNGKVLDALKVKVTLTGFKKMFWHADLWFDPQEGDLLKYKANEGPNTPTSIITLFSKQINE